MANYSQLKTAVQNVVKSNGAQEITGANLQSVLLNIINTIGANYTFAGIATPDTNPGSPDQNVFYLAPSGTYTNFGSSYTVPDGSVGVFIFNGSWNKAAFATTLAKWVVVDSRFVDVVGYTATFRNANLYVRKNGIVTTTVIDGSYTFSSAIDIVSYLVYREGNVLLVYGAGNVQENDIVLLGCLNGTYFGELAPQINRLVDILPKDSYFDSYTTNTDTTAGLWRLRSANSGNTITKQGTYFDITMTRSANPAIWVIWYDKVELLKGMSLFVTFEYKSDADLSLTLNQSDPSAWAEIPQSNEWRKYNGTLSVGNGYVDNRLMLFATSVTTCNLSIRNFHIYYQTQLNDSKLAAQLATAATNRIKGKRLSILGDSISTFGVPDQDNADGLWTYAGNRCRYPQADLLTEVNVTWWKQLMDGYNLILGINESWAGSMVSNTSETDIGDVGPNRCISSQTRIGHLGENGIPHIILIYAGANDIGNGVEVGTLNTDDPSNYTSEQIAALPVATFADGYRAMLIRVLKTYQSARVIVILPNFTNGYYNTNNLDKYIEVIKEACDYFGVEYIDARTSGITMYNRGTFLPDGIHPDQAGMSLLYRKVSEKFLMLSKIGM